VDSDEARWEAGGLPFLGAFADLAFSKEANDTAVEFLHDKIRGIVRDPAIHARVVEQVSDTAVRVGLTRLRLEPSPVTGAEGNQEFLLLLDRVS